MSENWIGRTVEKSKERKEAKRLELEAKVQDKKRFDELAHAFWERIGRIIKDALQTYNKLMEDPRMKLTLAPAASTDDIWIISREDYSAAGAHSFRFDRQQQTVSGGRVELHVSLEGNRLELQEKGGKSLTDDEIAEILLKDFFATQ